MVNHEDPKQRLPRYVMSDHLLGTNWRIELGGTTYEIVLRGYQPTQLGVPHAFTFPKLPEWAVNEVNRYLDVPDVRQRIIYALKRISIEPKDDELAAAMTKAFLERKFVLYLCVLRELDVNRIKGLRPEDPSPHGRAGHPPLKPDPPRPDNGGPTWFELRLVDEVGEPLAGVMARVRVDPLGQSVKTDSDGRVRVESRQGQTSGVGRVDDAASVRSILAERWANTRESEHLQPAKDWTFVTCPNVEPQALPMCRLTKSTPHTLVIQPDVVLVRFVGSLFPTNTTFATPCGHLRGLKPLLQDYPKANVLVVGHADHEGTVEANEASSIERAQALLECIRADVDAWMRRYEPSTPDEQRWGSAEDRVLLRSIMGPSPATPHDDRARSFQRSHNLPVDGIIGEDTRRALVGEYLSREGMSLPSTMDVVVHGCGDAFPFHSEPDADPAETQTRAERPLEILFFRDELGILPARQGSTSQAGSVEYPEWIRRAHEVHEFTLAKPRIEGLVVRLDGYYPGQRAFLPRTILSNETQVQDSLDLVADFLVALASRESWAQVVLGHSDPSGSSQRNTTITQVRAESVRALLVGDRDAWLNTLVDDDPEVAPRIFLAWVADRLGWDVHTGNEPGWNERCENAVATYRRQVAEHLDLAVGRGPKMEREDWSAGFALMEEGLVASLRESAEILDSLRECVSLPATRTYGCGETYSPSEAETPEHIRRVELLLIEEDRVFLEYDDPGAAVHDARVRLRPIEHLPRTAWRLGVGAIDGFWLGGVPFEMDMDGAKTRGASTNQGRIGCSRMSPREYGIDLHDPVLLRARERAERIHAAVRKGDLTGIAVGLAGAEQVTKLLEESYAEAFGTTLVDDVTSVVSGTPFEPILAARWRRLGLQPEVRCFLHTLGSKRA